MRALACSIALVFVTLAGCTSDREDPLPPPSPTILVIGSDGVPAGDALVSALADGVALAAFNADPEGRFPRSLVPPAATALAVTVPGGGAALVMGGPADLPDRIVLGEAPAEPVAGVLAFRPPVDLLCTLPTYQATDNCGQFGEPVVEVAADGTVWASATCCIGKAPPIWVSRDGGLSFEQLPGERTGLVRDTFGIEGDFAIDEAGNVYFFDISVVSMWFTSYAADGTHRWTVPWFGPPLVDRPWVRAGAEDQVWIFYNTGGQTNQYSSKDGGKTWSAVPDHTFPCALGAPGQGPTRNDLYVAASANCDGFKLWTSRDGGATWDAGDKIPMPDVPYRKAGGRGLHLINAPVADAAGNVYVPFTHFVDAKSTQNAVFVARRAPDGNWSAPVQVAPAGLHAMPWAAAGRDGHVGILWYGAEGNFREDDDAEWRLHAAVSVDAASADPHYQRSLADPEVLRTGPLGRALGDFLQSEITPDGRLVGVYAHRSSGGELTNRFVSSDGGLALA